ncbi:MAG: glucokinase [Alphaproteobacteria bacterium]|nr:glucokinase [Alphaproteobacteria bacterium]MCB9794931.1 glucokinase [Alphaproteobacteria bacterium]
MPAAPPPLVLSADVGGTNCRLGLFRGAELLEHRHVPTRGPGLPQVVAPFLAGRQPAAACIAVAGPVLDGRAELTNHHWILSEPELEEVLGCPVQLVNDFVAAARGVPELTPEGQRALHAAEADPQAPIAVLGPGTGLGQALLLPAPGGWRVLASQGGHVDFGPTDAEEDTLVAWLRPELGRVSYEDLLSGQGLLALHRFYLAQGRQGRPQVDPAMVVGSDSPAARAAVQRFCRVLGAQAGNVALSTLAYGGVYICGGIPPRLDLEGSELLSAFLGKGRMAALMRRIPLSVVTDPHLGLRGAAALALARLQEGAEAGG